MKTLTKLALAAVILTSALAVQAETVRGHFRSNGTCIALHYRSDSGMLANLTLCGRTMRGQRVRGKELFALRR